VIESSAVEPVHGAIGVEGDGPGLVQPRIPFGTVKGDSLPVQVACVTSMLPPLEGIWLHPAMANTVTAVQ
jgi:hypothetical protein